MKSIISIFSFLLSVLTGFSADVAISGLPAAAATSPSTNTLLEIADMNGSPKSRSITLENLMFSALTNTTTLTAANLGGRVGLYPTNIGSAQMSNSGVSAATYGDSTHVAQVAVDAKGRITSASNVLISQSPWTSDINGGNFSLTNVNTLSVSNFNANTMILTNALGVASGGTGKTNVTAGVLLSGNGTSPLDEVTIGSNLSLSGAPGSVRTLSASGGGGTGTTNQSWYDIRQFGGNITASDNTAALTNAIWSILGGSNTNNSVNATLFFPKGTAGQSWKFTGGPLNFEATEQAVIGIPHKAQVSGVNALQKFSMIEFLGESPVDYGSGTAVSGITPTNGTVLWFSTTSPCSIFKSMGWTTNTLDQFNFTAIQFKNLWISTFTNTAITPLDLQSFVDVSVKNCNIMRNYNGSSITTTPPTSATPSANSIAINLPQLDCGDTIILENITIDGFGYGLWLGEHLDANNVYITSCANAVMPKGATFPNHFTSLYTADCTTNIVDGPASSLLYIDNWLSERNASGEWRQNSWEYAGSGNIHGRARWFKHDDISSANDRIPWVTGNFNFKIVDGFQGREFGSGASATFGQRGQHVVAMSTDTVSAGYGMYKVRGTTSATAAASGDFIGPISFGAYDGTTFPGVITSYLIGKVNGAVSSGTVPTEMEFWSGTTAANTALQLTISQANGLVSTNGLSVASTGGGFAVGGGTAIQKMLQATATLDFGSTSAQSSTDLTITVTGAAANDPVIVAPPNGSVNANSSFSGWVSAADTVTVRFNNYSSGAIDPASGTFRAMVFKY